VNKHQREEWARTEQAFIEDSPRVFGEMSFRGRNEVLDSLHRYEATLHRISENECNGWDITGRGDESKEWRERDEKKAARIEAKVSELAERLGFKVNFNGDPRGGSIRFVLPSGRSNGWDSTSWGIYW
jgi:hypothetical protein